MRARRVTPQHSLLPTVCEYIEHLPKLRSNEVPRYCRAWREQSSELLTSCIECMQKWPAVQQRNIGQALKLRESNACLVLCGRSGCHTREATGGRATHRVPARQTQRMERQTPAQMRSSLSCRRHALACPGEQTDELRVRQPQRLGCLISSGCALRVPRTSCRR